MITALGTKPNIFHAVRAMKPAHSKTQAPGNASLSKRCRLSVPFCSESTAQLIFFGVSSETGGDGYPGVGEREGSQPEPAVLLNVPFLGSGSLNRVLLLPSMPG